MPRLYHMPLDPGSRRIRLTLAEYTIETQLLEERPGLPSDALLGLNPAAETPVFVDDDGTVACGVEAVSEYLEETRASQKLSLLGRSPAQRAETRRLLAWFDRKFHADVSGPLLAEKVVRRFLPRELGGGSPDIGRMRSAQASVHDHLEYIGLLADERKWLAGDELSSADLAAAAHLSCLDFIGEVPWAGFPAAKAWYQRFKSRPSFRPLLADHIRGITPPPNYADLDF